MDFIIWAFGGIGVFILGFFLKKPSAKKIKNKQVQRSGKNSTNHQYTGNITINSGKDTEKNETKMNHDSHREIDEVDLELKVYEKLIEYNENLDYHLEIARNPAANESFKLSNYEELNLLLGHIKDFRKEYYIVFSLLKDIDRQSNNNKAEYKEYTKEKLWMTQTKRDGFAETINKHREDLERKIEGKDIVEYRNYVRKAKIDFKEYFSVEKL